MTVNYEWTIENMEVCPEKDGYKNVVLSCNWRCNANEYNYNSTSYGTVGFELNLEHSFTEYSSLTKDQVIVWVKNSLGNEYVSQLEQSLAKEIQFKKSPKSLINSLPWECE